MASIAQEMPGLSAGRSLLIAAIGFLTLVDLFATQAILPSLAQSYGVTPAQIGVAANASTLGMAVAGIALLVAGPRGFGEIAGHFGVGALLALGAGVSYAVYAVAAKELLARVTPLAVSAITFALAAIFLAPALLAEPAPARALSTGWPLLVYLGLGPTAAAYALFTAGLGRVPATAAGIVSLLEPLTATTLGLVVFGERLGPIGVAGAGLLLAALALLATARR